MKKSVALLVCLMLMSAVFLPLQSNAYTTNQRSRAIHIVYDDSGSMIREDGVYLDRWGQAKYALEVFAAMLEARDTMRVYYMSDFDTSAGGSTNASARISMSGSEVAATRVAKIHDTVTCAANTPYDPVTKAYADLKNSDADEKWLVVLTDGKFNRLNGQNASNVDVDGFFSQYVSESDVKIIFMAIGDEFDEIKADPGRNIFFEHARNSNEILGRITEICNRIFNRNRLRFTNEARHEFSFDIPMLELLVFAQGADVKVNSISGDGTHSPDDTVNVRYSEVAATNYANDSNVIISRNLTGVVASFQNIPKGSYSLDINGAQTVEVYYKPAVKVDIKLFQHGEEILTQNLLEGDYQIRFGIVNENGEFFESSLLRSVEYEATAQNGGQTVSINSGDTISLKRGELTVHVLSHFLEINTAENTVTRRVLAPASPLEVDIAMPNDEFTVTNLNDTGAFIITVKHEGNLLTETQWQSMPMPVVTTISKVNIVGLKRGADVSTFEFYIKQMNSDKYTTSTGDITLTATAELEYDEQLCVGEGNITVNIDDDISFWERFQDWIKKYWYIFWPLLFLLLGLLLWWLLWGRKKRFPKYMSKTPAIQVETDNNTITKYGSFKINKKTKWMPLCPETGTIVAAADGKPLPPLKVKAVGNERMELTNTPDFISNRLSGVDFFINDQPLAEGSKRNKEMSCTARIKSVYYSAGAAMTHTCSFTKGKKRKK